MAIYDDLQALRDTLMTVRMSDEDRNQVFVKFIRLSESLASVSERSHVEKLVLITARTWLKRYRAMYAPVVYGESRGHTTDMFYRLQAMLATAVQRLEDAHAVAESAELDRQIELLREHMVSRETHVEPTDEGDSHE